MEEKPGEGPCPNPAEGANPDAGAKVDDGANPEEGAGANVDEGAKPAEGQARGPERTNFLITHYSSSPRTPT